MKILYLDCGMGAAGDMLTAALLELLPDPDSFIDKLNSIGIPGARFARESSIKCGITGTHMSVTVNGTEEDESITGNNPSATDTSQTGTTMMRNGTNTTTEETFPI